MTPADFIAAIVASPADDAPRLLYADWLDDNGESDRAEVIRAQCAAERRRLDGPMLDRSYAVRGRHPEWTAFALFCAWERGFVYYARVEAAVWQSRATEIVSSLAPLLSRLVVDVGPRARDAAATGVAVYLPERHRLRSVGVASNGELLDGPRSVEGQTGTVWFTAPAPYRRGGGYGYRNVQD